MTAEFNSSGFSAVTSFFQSNINKKDDTIIETKSTSTLSLSSSSSKKNNRLGLGSSSSSSSQNQNKNSSLKDIHESKKRILKIGNKKRKHMNDDDDDDEEEEKGNKEEADDDDDEEEGRTSVVKTKTQPNVDIAHLIASETRTTKPEKKKKKKKGKKERLLAEKEQESNQNNRQDSNENNNNNTNTINDEESNQNQLNTKNNKDGDASNDDKSKNKGRKKPKIRSKQKNVRKDNRPTHLKPDHLKIGSVAYQGRPLTQETREFLNMPESRTVSIRKERMKFKEEKNAKDGGGGDDDKLNEGFDTELGVDALLQDQDINTHSKQFEQTHSSSVDANDDSGEVVIQVSGKDEEMPQENKANSNSKKKKKKSKYKNLK